MLGAYAISECRMSKHPLPRNPNLFFLYKMLEQARAWHDNAATEADATYLEGLITELEVRINEMAIVISFLDHCYTLK